MPATSGSPTQQSTFCTSTAELESIEIDQFKTGDLAVVEDAGIGRTYQLVLDSVAVRSVVAPFLVLYTRNSNPLYGGAAGGTTPGRWFRTNLTNA